MSAAASVTRPSTRVVARPLLWRSRYTSPSQHQAHALSLRSFSATSTCRASSSGGGGGGGEERQPGRSPFAVFVQVLKEEIAKSREWQDSIKQLHGEAQKVQDAEAMKRARTMYEKARLTSSIRENPRLRAAAEEVRKAGASISDAVTEAVKTMEENPYLKGGREAFSQASQVVSSAVSTATEPVRSTDAYKAVAANITETIEEAMGNMRYGGFIEKDERRRRREARLLKVGKGGQKGMAVRSHVKVEEDPNAGTAVVASKISEEERTSFRSRISSLTPEPLSRFFTNVSNVYQESENPFVASLRSIGSTLGRITAETETAKVVGWVKGLDPNFQMEGFLKDLREYVVPEIVDAFVSGDSATLHTWCSEATYNVLTATIQPYQKRGLISDSRVLDIRGVDVVQSKILDNDIPVFIVAWRTQEILAFRDPKTGNVAEGSEHDVDMCAYVAVMTRVEEELDNEVTGGWKIIDMARRSTKAYI